MDPLKSQFFFFNLKDKKESGKKMALNGEGIPKRCLIRSFPKSNLWIRCFSEHSFEASFLA